MNNSKDSKANKSDDLTPKNKQNERRQLMLSKQKKERGRNPDKSRNICRLLKLLKDGQSYGAEYRFFRNYIQLSEWMIQKPEDFENWFMVPCPKGKRCIAVATGHSTIIYNKYGIFEKKFCSGLPGNQYPSRGITILDCFEVTSNNVTKYMVLDLMYYAYTDMINCEATLRFYWITHRLPELELEDVHSKNEFAFEPLNYVDCGDEIAMNACLTSYPMWNDENLQLDGFLFYHKESSYVHGETPLVGWLFSFMIRETLGYCDINPKYLEDTPADYIDVNTFMSTYKKNRHISQLANTDLFDLENLNLILNDKLKLEPETVGS